MINLGDVTFSVGADTTRLLNSIDTLNRFSITVTQAQQATDRAGQRTAAAFRRQEKAAGDAFNKMSQLNAQMSRMEGAERFVRANEAAFARFNQALTRGRLSALDFQRAQESFRRSLLNTTMQFRDFRDTGGGLVPMFQNLASGLVLVSGPLGGLATRVISLTAVMKRGGIEVAAFVAGLAVGAAGILSFGRAILNVGKQIKGFESQFQAVTGSVVGGWKGVAEAINIARTTGARIEDLANGMARFRASAEGTGIAMKDVNTTFRTVAAASTKLQLGSEATFGIFRALEQMMSKGTVQAEELRGQLGDRLPGAVQIAARAMGVTTYKLQEMMKKGLVPTREFLPKFAAELARTFRIDNNPIDNYTASANNLHNAWFQLLAQLDSTFNVTTRVMEAMKRLTGILDSIRENLGKVKLAVTAAVGALAGFFAPAVIGGLASLVMWIGRLATGVGVVNGLLAVSPVGMFVRLAAVIGGATFALTKYRDEIILVEGSYATLGDYQREVWSDMESTVLGAIDTMKGEMSGLESPWKSVNDLLKKTSNTSWTDIKEFAITEINGIVFAFRSAMNEIPIIFKFMKNNLLADSQGLATVINEIYKFMQVKGPDNPFGKDAEWFTNTFKDVEYTWKPLESLNRQLEAMRDNIDDVDSGERFIKYLDDLHQRANALGKDRALTNFRQSELKGWGQEFGTPGYKPGGTPSTKIADNVGRSDKELKKLERAKTALEDMNREIARTYEEIDALQGADAGLKALNDQFKREDEVRKYAKAMEKAGIATDIVRAKSAELLAALEFRDKLEEQRKVLEEWQQTLTSAFDSVASTLVDAMFDGGESMKKLPDIARAVARDIFNTFLQLQLMNPLKNMLFGTNLPTSGGLFGGIGGFGGLGNVFPAAPIGGGVSSGIGLWRNGGISSTPLMKYARNGIVSSPTMMATSSGPVLGGEAGAEALMPLSKDSKGRYGVDAHGLGQKTINQFTYAPVNNFHGTSEELRQMKAIQDQDRAAFESRTLAILRKAPQKRKAR